MKSGNFGIALILFAIFLTLNSSGMELFTFIIALTGLGCSIAENIVQKKEK